MRRFLGTFALILILGSCSNTPELETGEIKTLNLLKDAIFQSGSQKVYVDARNLLGREQIDAADVPILFYSYFFLNIILFCLIFKNY